MSAVIPTEGRVFLAKRVLYANAATEDLVLRVFKNNVTPGLADTAATYTEATFTGYAPITLTSSQTGSTWSVPIVSSNLAVSSYQTLATWTAASDQTVYGWYITSSVTNKLCAAQAFPSPRALVGASGDTLSIPPIFNGGSL